jgi:phosphate transport system permease protein
MAAHATEPAAGSFPEGEKAHHQVARRQRRGLIWGWVFIASTLVGIVALTALLYNVLNSSFGYVAVQNEVEPEVLVTGVVKEQMLAAANVTPSADDEAIAQGVAGEPNAVGFFGYAYAQRHTGTLRVVPIEGVAPTPETVESGAYPLARPLLLYSARTILAQKPEVAAFVHYYLTHAGEVIGQASYFPASAAAVEVNLAAWQEATELTAPPAVTDGEIRVTGSSTVYPLTQRMAEGFAAAGYQGQIRLDAPGTNAGIPAFCTKEGADLIGASRALQPPEITACRKAKRTPVEFRAGTDAVAVVVNRANTFVDMLSVAQLHTLLTSAQTWADVNPAWPAAPVTRFIPGPESGTLDFVAQRTAPSDLAGLPKETLVAILRENVSAGLMRRLEHDQPFAERSQENIYDLVLERVVEPKIIRSWSLVDSLLHRDVIVAEAAAIPHAHLQFQSWINWDFMVSPQSAKPEMAGIRTAVLGSLWTIAITILFSLPLGVGAAIYLEEYAGDTRLNRLIETNINNLAGVPSIIYGMLGLAIFVRALEGLTSGAFFGVGDPATANGRTVLSAGLTLGLLILPLIIINAREAIRAVPASLRQASLGLGATQWQTIWSHVLPAALPGIMTGAILAVSRAIGETAPLVVVGASTFIVVDPAGPFAKFTTLPIQIYQWTSRPQAEFRNLAAAAIVALLILLLSLNAVAILLRNRFSQQ